MSYGARRGRGRPTKASSHIPEDGWLTIQVDSIRDDLHKYMGTQPQYVSLNQAALELMTMGLASQPEESSIHIERMRAFRLTQRWVYRTLAAAFSQMLHDLENTAVILEGTFDGDGQDLHGSGSFDGTGEEEGRNEP